MDDLTVWDEPLSPSDLMAMAENGVEAFLEQRGVDTDGDGLPDLWEQTIIDADEGDAVTGTGPRDHRRETLTTMAPTTKRSSIAGRIR